MKQRIKNSAQRETSLVGGLGACGWGGGVGGMGLGRISLTQSITGDENINYYIDELNRLWQLTRRGLHNT